MSFESGGSSLLANFGECTLTHEINRLAQLISPDAYQAERAHIFPSKTSLQWFMRTRRDELIKAKALTSPTGRIMIDAFEFDQVVLRVGHELMERTHSPKQAA